MNLWAGKLNLLWNLNNKLGAASSRREMSGEQFDNAGPAERQSLKLFKLHALLTSFVM